jgi:hypothetical protein
LPDLPTVSNGVLGCRDAAASLVAQVLGKGAEFPLLKCALCAVMKRKDAIFINRPEACADVITGAISKGLVNSLVPCEDAFLTITNAVQLFVERCEGRRTQLLVKGMKRQSGDRTRFINLNLRAFLKVVCNV